MSLVLVFVALCRSSCVRAFARLGVPLLVVAFMRLFANGLNFACVGFSCFGGVVIGVLAFRVKIGVKIRLVAWVAVVCLCRFCLVA